MYQALLSSLVFVAAMAVLHLVVKRMRVWWRARKEQQARELAAWTAQENAQFQQDQGAPTR